MAEIRVIVSWSTSGREITRELVPQDGINQWLTELVIRFERDMGTTSLNAATMRFGVEGSPFTTGPAGILHLIHGTRMTNLLDMELRIQVTAMAQMQACEICGEESPEIPFTDCRYCGVSPSLHHGRCCPMNHRTNRWRQ